MQLIAGADRRWLPVAQVRAEDGQGQPLPASLLPLHHGQRLPRQEAGNHHPSIISLLPFLAGRHSMCWSNTAAGSHILYILYITTKVGV